MLERFGLLLFSDPALPSLVGIIVDEPLRSSWWGHPRGHVIYHAMNELDDDPESSVHQADCRQSRRTSTAACGRRLQCSAPRASRGNSRTSRAGARWLLDEVDAEGALQTGPGHAPTGSPRRQTRRGLCARAGAATAGARHGGAHAERRARQGARDVAALGGRASSYLAHPSTWARVLLEESAARLSGDVPAGRGAPAVAIEANSPPEPMTWAVTAPHSRQDVASALDRRILEPPVVIADRVDVRCASHREVAHA